jgi:uncharacterized protein
MSTVTPTTWRAPGDVPGPPIGVAEAAVFWLGAWLFGNIAGATLLSWEGSSRVSEAPIWVVAASAMCLWVPLLAVVWIVSRRFGTGDVRADYAVRFRPLDLVGVPIGVACQLVLVPALYWPLSRLWPDTFDSDRVEQNARDLYDRADGGWLVVLVVVVVFGAPIVEELVYRGLLQGAVTRRVPGVAGVLLVAAWFALIHFRPVEYPGLFVFGAVLGWCAWSTRRLGLGIVTHMAFNATGLAMVALIR